uniref:Uncharacterized protein n=1 Tax=Panagrolaimus superbus TaxID=310955 RepID=A0A914YIU0_9BILA
MALLPNIEQFQIVPINVNENTANALANLKFNAKIHTFIAENISGSPFDINELVNYFNINRKKYFNLTLLFKDKEDYDQEFLKNLKLALVNYQKALKNTLIVFNYEPLENIV